MLDEKVRAKGERGLTSCASLFLWDNFRSDLVNSPGKICQQWKEIFRETDTC